jgi:hypothetical protein
MDPPTGHANVNRKRLILQVNQRPLGESIHPGDPTPGQLGVRQKLSLPGRQGGPPPCQSRLFGDLRIDDNQVVQVPSLQESSGLTGHDLYFG